MISNKLFWTFYLALMVSVLTTLQGCQSEAKHKANHPDERILAQVDQLKLLHKDLIKMLPQELNGQDSIAYLRSLTERWVRDEIMIIEAEKRLAQTLNIDQLIEEYKKSLLLHQFENKLISQYLDTVIHEIELNEYYEKNKDSYILSEPIARLFFVKINRNNEQIDKIKDLLKKQTPGFVDTLKAICDASAQNYILDDISWFTIQQISELWPDNHPKLHTWKKNKLTTQTIGDYTYITYLLDLLKTNETAPLEYVRLQVEKIMLQKRKIKFIESIKKQIYQEALKSQRIKIYI